MTHAARIRAMLATGPHTSAEIAAVIGCEPTRVGALLKNDLHAGRVHYRDGGYVLVPQLPRQIAEARALLERHGYRVTRRSDGAG